VNALEDAVRIKDLIAIDFNLRRWHRRRRAAKPLPATAVLGVPHCVMLAKSAATIR